MRILLMLLLFWLARCLVQKVRAWRQHRKLVRQLKDLGVYGGTVRVKGTENRPTKPLPTLSQEPDGPVPFGYKTAWLVLRCTDPKQAAEALHCGNMQHANWATGLFRSGEAGGEMFCSPVLDGFVLVIGQKLFDLTGRRDRLEALAGQFSQVQYFASHRVSSSYCWVRCEAGRCVRAYGIADGGVFWNTGELTPEERSLGFDAFPVPGAEETDRWPDEEDVLDIAAAWGIDPRFEKKMYPPSAGWLCG